MNTDVTVIGLGAMGSALARALMRGGRRVTAWNRTGGRGEALAREGAALAPTAAAAVAASPIIIACVAGYEATRQILGPDDVPLAGRALVQLSTGTPQDAREAEAWARARGADYLDGAILATPSQVGRPDTPLFASGAEAAYRRAEADLRIIAGNLMYAGAPVGSAAAWDLGVLTSLFGALFGFLHGARVFESEGLAVGDLGAMIARIAPVLGEMIEHAGDAIQSGDFGDPQSSVEICTGGFELFAKQAREANINAEFPEFALGLGRRAIASGYGAEEFAAVIKVLREGPAAPRAS